LVLQSLGIDLSHESASRACNHCGSTARLPAISSRSGEAIALLKLLGLLVCLNSHWCSDNSDASQNNTGTSDSSQDLVVEGHLLGSVVGIASRTTAPSPLTFRGSGHPLVSRWNSCGEEQVNPSALGFGQ
jgi:hypothetical protein